MNSSGMFDSGLIMLSGYLAGALIGLGVAILIGAIMLRLAARVLKFPTIRFEVACYATAVAAVTLFSMHFSFLMNYVGVISSIMPQGGSFGQNGLGNIAFALNPIYMTFSTTLGILLSALIYQRLLEFENVEHDDDLEVQPTQHVLKFGDAVTLTAVQVGITMLCCLVLTGMFAFSVLFLTRAF